MVSIKMPRIVRVARFFSRRVAKIAFAFFLVLCANFALANPSQSTLNTKIINLIGENDYNRNKSFINKLFADESSFYRGGNLDIHKVISVLQNNGLLRLKFSTPQEFNAIFVAHTNPVLLLKTINQSMAYMGYSYWTPSEAEYENERAKVRISLITEHIIDPLILLNEIQRGGFVVVNINQNRQNEWEYHLELMDSTIPGATFVAKGNNISVVEVSGQYWLEVGNLGVLEVESISGKNFNPKIVLFDRNLNILDIQELARGSGFSVDLADNTKFIKISDSIQNANLKSGINIRLK